MLHTLIAVVENKPGVLNRVSSLFRRRNFNIASLTVGETENPDVSRMTIVVDTKKTQPHSVIENLYKMVYVIEVRNLTDEPSVQRDLVLLKVKTDVNTRPEVMQFATLYHAKIVDIMPQSLMLEMTGEPAEVDRFINIVRPFGIIEMVRTGVVAMARGTEPTSTRGNQYRL